jgi:hypothetical protein
VGAYEDRTSNTRGAGRPPRQQTGLDPGRLFQGGFGGGGRGRGGQQGYDGRASQEEPERSFVDDELPIIKENLRKGFQETQKTVNTWFQTMKKRFDEEFAEEPSGSGQHQQQHQYQQQQQQRPGQGSYRGGRPSGETGRRSGDYERYDADPQVLSDDFAGMKFHNDGSEFMPRNPYTHKHTPSYSVFYFFFKPPR